MPADMKQIIAEATRALLTERRLKKLTVKDIVERCNITRQTFYYHFEDIPDLFRWMIREYTNSIFKEALSDENAETELTLRNKLDLSKSEMVKILADAYTQINHILEMTNSKIERQAAKEQTPESTAESKILLAEYALDFAAQAADQALLLSLQAIDAQLQEEGKIQ